MERNRKEEALKLKVLRAEIHKGLTELDTCEYVDVDESELESFMESLLPAQGSATVRPLAKRTGKR